MPRQIAILHGYSDTSNSFKPLVSFLNNNGFETVPLWLGDYISLASDGSNIYTVKAVDLAGNVSAASTSKTIVFDNTPPGQPANLAGATPILLNSRPPRHSGT